MHAGSERGWFLTTHTWPSGSVRAKDLDGSGGVDGLEANGGAPQDCQRGPRECTDSGLMGRDCCKRLRRSLDAFDWGQLPWEWRNPPCWALERFFEVQRVVPEMQCVAAGLHGTL